MKEKNIENTKQQELVAVKIGRKEYPVKKGDYILYNGACYQFCSGDGRTLKSERYTQYTNLRLPDVMVKKIPFESMKKQNYNSMGMDLVRWYASEVLLSCTGRSV